MSDTRLGDKVSGSVIRLARYADDRWMSPGAAPSAAQALGAPTVVARPGPGLRRLRPLFDKLRRQVSFGRPASLDKLADLCRRSCPFLFIFQIKEIVNIKIYKNIPFFFYYLFINFRSKQ